MAKEDIEKEILAEAEAEVKKEKKAPAKEKKKTPAKKEEKAKKETPKKEEKKDDKKKGEEEEENKIIKESVHTIPLRKAFEHPRTKRVKYAAREIKRYIKKHTRKEPVIDPSVNEALWKNNIEKPPRRMKVKIQEEEKRAIATLP